VHVQFFVQIVQLLLKLLLDAFGHWLPSDEQFPLSRDPKIIAKRVGYAYWRD
jgi:hypothetical protein